MSQTVARVWTKDEIATNMESSDLWLVRGLMAIYNRQTEDEKEMEQTKHYNGAGFNGLDSHLLSSFAKQFHMKGWLSAKQMAILRKKMRKYAGQLAKIANGLL